MLFLFYVRDKVHIIPYGPFCVMLFAEIFFKQVRFESFTYLSPSIAECLFSIAFVAGKVILPCHPFMISIYDLCDVLQFFSF